ncbi:MAG TPA: CTP synthase [Phycisphaerae bacterium]|mgnify:CR=1 FL=1|nr:CTP synthase [Phycisphaerae bacterium]HQE44113.1 CTP synthase [Phycisphaerae bacterium]
MDAEKILASLSTATDETEFYAPMPAGYRPGKTKYVIVFGTVMSGLGKGIFSSTLAKCLKDKGLTVAPIKLEGYLNVDSGTLNPYRHGEVFVLDDGMETDMDLGTYERMLDQNLSRLNFATSGQIFTRVLEKERKGSYLGRDVQMIPHVTGEVKIKLRELAVATDADVVFVEVGGTVGDVENTYYIEAVRELAFEEGPDSCCFVALTYIINPAMLGEQKSKAAQLGIRGLLAAGIQPHIIACRGREPVTRKVREKLAIYSNVPVERMFSMHDCESIYLIPDMIRGAGLDEAVLKILNIETRVHPEADLGARKTWSEFVGRIRSARKHVRIGVMGKYTSVRDSYASIIHALEHAGTATDAHVEIEWVDTTDLTDERAEQELGGLHGIIVPGGFGVRGAEGKIAAIRYAREHQVPYLGLCYGFQMAVIEYARHVCGLADANSTEIDPDTPHPVVDILPEQKQIEGLGGNMRLGGRDVLIKPGTLAAKLFNNAPEVRLRFRHRYEVDPKYIDILEKGGLVFSGKAPDYPIMQILELPPSVHPYFVGTQAHPEFQSRPLRPQPMFLGLVKAALERAERLAGKPAGAAVESSPAPTLA